MGDLTNQSDRLIEEGRRLRDDNRTGGRHRRVTAIGEGSRRVHKRHFWHKIRNIAIVLFALYVGMGVLGMVIGGLGFAGIMALLVATVVAVSVLSNYPKIKVPSRSDINKGDVRQMVARTELWLEHQAPALPAPAAQIVSDMGVQLDTLGFQLEGLDQQHPKAREVRALVGEQLPEMIDSYCRIPPHLRQEKRAGSTPDEQLTDSLGKISSEIDSITRQLAEGSLDDLAIKHRYLDYRYGSGIEGGALEAPKQEQT